MNNRNKMLSVLLVVLLMMCVAVLYPTISFGDKGKDPVTMADLLGTEATRSIDSSGIIVMEGQPLLTIAASPVAVSWVNESPTVEPLLITGERSDQFLSMYTPPSLLEAGAEAEDPTISSIELAGEVWSRSGGLMMIGSETESYGIALTMAPLACYMGIPIVISDRMTTELSNLCKELNVEYTINCGPNVTGLDRNMAVETVEEARGIVLEYISERFGRLGYITVTNPADIESDYGIAGLSCLAPYLTAARLGVVVACQEDRLPKNVNFEPTQEEWGVLSAEANGRTEPIKLELDDIMDALPGLGLEASYLESPYLAILGDPYSVPFYYTTDASGPDELFATDDYYADLDDDIYSVELACGRPMGLTLSGTSAIISRTLCYERYMSSWVADSPAAEASDTPWKDAAYVAKGDDWNGAIWYMTRDIYDCRLYLQEQGFTVYMTNRHSTGEHVAQERLKLYTSSNLIYICAHGCPQGYQNADMISSEDVLSWGMLGPSAMILTSCSAGRTDVNDIHGTISLAFMETGMCCYIGGTRTEYADSSPWLSIDSIQYLLEEDGTTGMANMESKNHFMESGGDYYSSAIKQLYGDPAFNPYEP